MKKVQHLILRRRTNDPERDRYEYYVDCVNGVEITTPFKLKAKVIMEGESVLTFMKLGQEEWKPLKVVS